MGMDEQLFRRQHGWSLQLQSGQEIRLTPGAQEANESLCVTDIFLVDPESVAGQSAVAACVEISTRNIILAVLSSEKPRVKLQIPVELDEEFCFYLMRPGAEGEGIADADADADAVVVEFQGYALPSSASTMEEIEEDDEEEDMIDDVNHQEEEEEEEEGDIEDTEDDEDVTGSESDFEGYDSRDDGDTCGLPFGAVIDDGPNKGDEEEDMDDEAGMRITKASRGGRNKLRHRRSFVTEDEWRYLAGRIGAEHGRRFAPELVVLGIFAFLYLLAMVVVLIG